MTMFEVSKSSDISILHLYGEITLLEMDFIQKLIASLKKYQHNKILLDLANVDHVHFQAVHRWGNEALALQASNGDLRLVAPNEQTRQMIQFVGADQHLKDYMTTAEAILSFLNCPDPLEGDPRFLSTGRGDNQEKDRWGQNQDSEVWWH